MIRVLSLTALILAAAAMSAPAQQRAATTNTNTNTAAAAAAVDDALFAGAAATAGLAEVTISQLGLQRATNSELKQFSQKMIDEHSQMNQQLAALAAKKGIALPRAVDVKSQFCAQSLAGLSGEKFDHCYAKAQLTAHMEAVATFEAEAERGQDPDVKALASQALPKIKEHLRMIKPIAMRYEKEKEKDQSSRASSSSR